MSASPAESANRTRKALRLAEIVQRHIPETVTDDAVAEAVGAMPANWWADVAAEADVRPPSAATIAATVVILRERQSDEDPFACFDGTDR